MADADRDSDLGDDSPVSARSEGDSSGDQSCESSDEGVGRDVPPAPQQLQPQTISHQPHNMTLHNAVNHQIPNNHHINKVINNHSSHNQKTFPRPQERDIKGRDEFESLKTSLHPHLSSLASLAQGPAISTTGSVYALANGVSGNFHYPPPAFLAPAPPAPAQPAGSASSSSSEGSAAGWSFEEQYKQVRQLYELSDEPERKEFLDELFSFMQRRGTPITRLPIMAKSVLDLYELYNLVVARQGLVEVINKKLWQEVIRGLKLPSSITSAAFTLRTQYMRYLYDFECEKKNFSTRAELELAIDGNKREGRRSSGQYDPHTATPHLNRPSYTQAALALASQVAAGSNKPLPSPYLHPELFGMWEHMKLEPMKNALTEGTVAADQYHKLLANVQYMYSKFYSTNQAAAEPQREALNLSEMPSFNSDRSEEGSVAKRPRVAITSPTPGPSHHASSTHSISYTPSLSPITPPSRATAPRVPSPRPITTHQTSYGLNGLNGVHSVNGRNGINGRNSTENNNTSHSLNIGGFSINVQREVDFDSARPLLRIRIELLNEVFTGVLYSKTDTEDEHNEPDN